MKCAIKDCENQVSLLCLSCHALISGEGLPSQAYRNSRRMIETALIRQTEQEPVAWLQTIFGPGGHVYYRLVHDSEMKDTDKSNYAPLYASPPQREWVGLTRTERFEIERAMSKYYDYQHECKTVCLPEFAAAIEAKLKEKNT